ncbi:MAG: PhzF family phenazine biosynthesis protein [Pseudomonadota bacterium]|nr:PhzF family phenazine biosynthesis protein [Pseudomonadota bacterium]
MKCPLYWVDAFTKTRFRGNPAAVVITDRRLDAGMMQAIAHENNLAETAFVVADGNRYAIRWFTPTVEVDLCGHATLASAFALYHRGLVTSKSIEFTSASGPLHVTRAADRLALDFPARPASICPDLTQSVAEALGCMPTEIHKAQATMVVFRSEDEVRSLKPDMDKVARIPTYGVVATAPGMQADFVSRFFAPRVGVPEDPVTGSTHCTLVPYWSARLGKAELYAQQLSDRGGELWCEDRGHRVAIAGNCALYLTGEIEV